MSFVVIATWTAQEGSEELVLDALRELSPLSREEPDCLTYQVHTAPESPAEFVIYEQYVNAQGWETHRATEHFRRLGIDHAFHHLASREVKTLMTLPS